MWQSHSYAKLDDNMTLPVLMDGIKDSFVIHYFGSHYDVKKGKLKKSSPLIGIMEEHCPTAAEIVKSELKS